MMNGVNQNELGRRIKNAREKKNMSQHELYEKTGISTTQISAYENGKKSLGLQTLAKISSALGLTLDELYYGSASSKPISSSLNIGELIVNCVYALYRQGVISALVHQEENEYVGTGTGFYYQIGFSNHVDILNDLIIKLKDFEDNKDDYPDPEGFRNQLLAAASKRINARTKKKAAK